MKITQPYSDIELSVAAIGLDAKMTDELMDKIGEELNTEIDVDSIEKLNRATAEANGITLDQLINSPNMELMLDNFKRDMFMKSIAIFEKHGFTNKEAWVIMRAGLK